MSGVRVVFRLRALARIPLVGLLASVALLDLALNRVSGQLLPRGGWRTGTGAPAVSPIWLEGRLFLFDLVCVLSVLTLAAALVQVCLFSTRHRIGARVAYGLIGAVCVTLSALGTGTQLPGNLQFHLHLSLVFLALLVTLNTLASRAPGRVRLGMAILFAPIALHFLARLARASSPSPELATIPLRLEWLAQVGVSVAAIASVACFASIGRLRLVVGAALSTIVVGSTVLSARLDWISVARMIMYGLGLALPIAPWAMFSFVVALGGFTFTVATLLLTPGAGQLRGWGLMLIGLAGLQPLFPYQVALAAVGLLCMADSATREPGDREVITQELFERIIRRGATAIGAARVTLTGTGEFGTARMQSPPDAEGPTIAVSIEREAGSVSALEITLGAPPQRDPPLTIERRARPRLGPRTEGPAIETGDTLFDRRFLMHDRRGLSAQLLDDSIRTRIIELLTGWLGVWPQQRLQYRAAALAADEEALSKLIELLRDLAVRAN